MQRRLTRERLSLGAAVLALICAAPIAATAQATFQFNLPAQPLADSLRAVGSRTGANVAFDPAALQGRRAEALNGAYSTQAALQKLVAGAGLNVRPTIGGSFIVEPARPQPAAETIVSANDEVLSEIVVTGTFLRGGTPASAVVSISRADIDASGVDSAGALIRLLPQAFGGGHQSTVVGAGGQAQLNNHAFADSPNLRGLGSDATLSLVNGQRLSPTATGHAADVSIIPLALVERVEVLTDGASALYGSDAVGGVVNFVLRRRFSGNRTSAELSTPTRSGGADTYRFSHLSGSQWSSGGAMIGAEYLHRDPLLSQDRRFSASAPDPTDLAPDYTQRLLFARAEQEVGGQLTFDATALFSEKDVVRRSTGTSSTTTTRVDVQQPNVLLGAEARLPADWRLKLGATWGRDRTESISTVATNTLLSASHVRYERYGAEAVVDGDLLAMWGGPLKAALGAGWRRETLDMRTATSAAVTTQAGERDVVHAFVQADAPLVGSRNRRPGIHSLVLTGSLRYEDTSEVGGELVPRVGAIYRIVPELGLRATWGKSFKSPALVQQSASAQAFVTDVVDPQAGGRAVPVLFRTLGAGGGLEPETSDALSVGLDWSPSRWPGLKFGLNYFDIDYRGRITQPVVPITAALSNPAYATVVTRAPSAELQRRVIAAADQFQNFSAQPYDPSRVAAYVFNAYQNIARQKIKGLDLSAQYKRQLAGGNLTLNVDATRMETRQRLTPGSVVTELTGVIFNAPNWRGRAGAVWTGDRFFGAVFANYSGELVDPTLTPNVEVRDQLTWDAQLGVGLGATRLALNFENLLDASPPPITARATTPNGLGFDATNASPSGRVVRLSLTQRW